MEGGSPSARAGLVPRALNVLLGCWLFASVFRAGPALHEAHESAQRPEAAARP